MSSTRRPVQVQTCFATSIYHARLEDAAARNAELEALAYSLADDDEAGKTWCEAHGYEGYTSYASLNDLPWRFPPFADLRRDLDQEVRSFAERLEMDLGGRPLTLDSLWVNILAPGGGHSGHIHPNSVISGTYYVRVPAGVSPLRFEDPRLPLMMAAPPRRADSAFRPFVYIQPSDGDVLLWESWLRHEVPPTNVEDDRISISFNYRWGA